ncbi:Eco57I restriction-modification methylase domain-containing protein [Nocardia wallacei]|uniref:Eco57I restriction-modification methylase domain-containing protein n=1 Tax=Nocardia wallacei TaxID=480035 RepID=UPI002456A6B4|nr:DNA methyltransferase [Nocardia wallacei]
MTKPVKKFRKRPPQSADLHRAWLELVDTDGPFLSIPLLKQMWPTGMPAMRTQALETLRDAKPVFEKAWEDWDQHRNDEAALERYSPARDKWVDTVLRDVIGWGALYVPDAPASVKSPDHAVTVAATGALVHRDLTGALVLVVDPVDSLRDPLEDGWANTPIDRMEELLRGARVGIGVVTDGRWWAIVSARPDTMPASGVVDAQTWIEEPPTRNAFIELLNRKYLVGGNPEHRLTELFGRSVAAAEEITEALGVQVRQAVELLVQALSESALDAVAAGELDPLPEQRHEVYEAAVTVMMRVVFLLFAEERGLLPESTLFTMGYGLSSRLDVLDQRARDEGSEALDGTFYTWHRLLATSQALYRGASFEDMRLPAYGGSLFDPARFEFLTARTSFGTLTISISDRVMLEVLRAVQVATPKGQDARQISFRDIDVEQIGYIYEGLLGYSAAPVDEVTVGLIGTKGMEPEIPLAQLESFAAEHNAPDRLAETIIAWAKENQPGAKAPTKAALAKAIRTTADVDDTERALLAITRDENLRARLRPFIGIIRRDLRERPFVVTPGGVVVIETPSRSTAGAHYTPRSLAEEVVQHALEPLVYSPGPHQTADRNTWKLVSSEAILDLKVADIACGSGAFLVAAARYLAARLVEAWRNDGIVRPAHEMKLHAIREVVAHCLYGADINEMAVEMCKLSLWLVSLDPSLPFSFVDDKVLHGNSLLGLTDVRQLKTMHIYPDQVSDEGQYSMFDLDVDDVLDRAARLRRNLASEVDNRDPQRSATTKRRQWKQYQDLTEQLRDIADGVVAAGLVHGGKPGKALNAAYADLGVAVAQAYPSDGSEPNRRMLDRILAAGLTPAVETDYERWQPLHWLLTVPDVIHRGGFDAVIGNPPFLGGQKLTGSMGTNVRDWFVNVLASGQKGSADLVAYFFLRAISLLTGRGDIGLIATNTLAQGDTREVGLDRIVADGLTITRSIQSRSWPSASANLEYAAVWGTRGRVSDAMPRISEDIAVRRISTLLEPAGRVEGQPVRLAENTGTAFIGCYVLGMGFVLKPDEATAWIAADPRNAEVLFPYLNGEDLNSRPDTSASRWVIDFNNRSEEEAQTFPLPYTRVLEQVKTERAKKPKAVSDAPWWLFLRSRPKMRMAIANLDEVLVIALVSKTVMPMRVSADQVFSHKLGVFATESFAEQAILSSSLHQTWTVKYSSTMRTDINYSPSDVFETFPRPQNHDQLAEIGQTLDTERREIMLRRNLGLTKLFNLVNDPGITDGSDPDIARLRQIHVELDNAVAAAYGWDDILLDHGFHTYRQMQRWTVSPAARVELLDRLLEENHRRAALQGDNLILPTEDPDVEEVP